MLGGSEPIGLHVRTMFRVLLEQQEQKGLQEYGELLNLDSKIDPLEYGLAELVDAFSYITLGMLKRDSGTEGRPASESAAIMRAKADTFLRQMHEEMRNGIEPAVLDMTDGAVGAFVAVGLLTATEGDLWEHRFRQVCPGHEGDGGRGWCAYCGDMPAVAP